MSDLFGMFSFCMLTELFLYINRFNNFQQQEKKNELYDWSTMNLATHWTKFLSIKNQYFYLKTYVEKTKDFIYNQHIAYISM